MFESFLRRLFADPEPLPATDARLALAALLVRVARTDGLYAAEEVERIDRVLAQRYGLDAFDVSKLRAEAEVLEDQAPDTVGFTRALKTAVPLEDRAGLVEALWSVALSDGDRNPEEDQLLRLVAGLLGLSDVENAQARARAARRD